MLKGFKKNARGINITARTKGTNLDKEKNKKACIKNDKEHSVILLKLLK
jgi:hypothetical protein